MVSQRNMTFSVIVFVYWLSLYSALFIVHILCGRVLLESFSSCFSFVCMFKKDRENHGVCVSGSELGYFQTGVAELGAHPMHFSSSLPAQSEH